MDVSTPDLVKLVLMCYAASVFVAYSILLAIELMRAETRYDVHAAFSGELVLVALVWFIVLPITAIVWSAERIKVSIENLANYIADKRGL